MTVDVFWKSPNHPKQSKKFSKHNTKNYILTITNHISLYWSHCTMIVWNVIKNTPNTKKTKKNASPNHSKTRFDEEIIKIIKIFVFCARSILKWCLYIRSGLLKIDIFLYGDYWVTQETLVLAGQKTTNYKYYGLYNVVSIPAAKFPHTQQPHNSAHFSHRSHINIHLISQSLFDQLNSHNLLLLWMIPTWFGF